MTATDVLRAVAALYENPDAWTTRAIARDADGRVLPSPTSETAARWCLAGAIQHYAPNHSVLARAANAVSRAIHPHGYRLISPWNDEPGRTIEDVRRVVAAAVALLEGEATP